MIIIYSILSFFIFSFIFWWAGKKIRDNALNKKNREKRNESSEEKKMLKEIEKEWGLK